MNLGCTTKLLYKTTLNVEYLTIGRNIYTDLLNIVNIVHILLPIDRLGCTTKLLYKTTLNIDLLTTGKNVYTDLLNIVNIDLLNIGL